MKKVLIVSPIFLPNSSADMQRIRVMLSEINQFGWEATVLAANPEQVSAVKDLILYENLPNSVNIFHFDLSDNFLIRLLGVRHVGWKALIPAYHLGLKLLRSQSFDLVYFSNTAFITWILGPVWKKLTKVPYVLDFQDPWWRFQPRTHPATGSYFKRIIAKIVARLGEPFCMKNCSGFTTVSEEYLKKLCRRYKLSEGKCLFVPFGSSPKDYELLKKYEIKNDFFDPTDGKKHLVYIGRLGEDILPALRIIFESFINFSNQQKDLAAQYNFYFIGTSYDSTASAKSSAWQLAQSYGLNKIVYEHPARISYLSTLKIMQDSSGIIVLGSTDPDYNPSKLFPALLSEKPVICLANPNTALASFISRQKTPLLFFDLKSNGQKICIFEKLLDFQTSPLSAYPDTLLDYLLAEKMTGRICDFFDKQTHDCRSI